MATHPAIFDRPLSTNDAARNVEALLTLPHLRVLSKGEGSWKVYREVTASVPARGNLVNDAHLASLLKRHGIKTLYTNDRGFRRFDFLEVRNPFRGLKQ